VLCAALEDLPMGVLSIVLTSSLPAGEKLSIINQLSIAWSWLNLGGKILKATALPRLWSEEKDLKRKLGKHEAAAADPASDAAMQASIDPDADDQPRAPVPDGFLHAVRHFLRNLLSRKNARQGDAELELVHAFMIQAKAEGAAKKRANQPQAAVLSDAHQPASQPTVCAHSQLKSACAVCHVCVACRPIPAKAAVRTSQRATRTNIHRKLESLSSLSTTETNELLLRTAIGLYDRVCGTRNSVQNSNRARRIRFAFVWREWTLVLYTFLYSSDSTYAAP